MKITPELKKLLNSISCPICKGQIDIQEKYKGYNFGCVNQDHYILRIKNNFSIEMEKIAIQDFERLLHYEVVIADYLASDIFCFDMRPDGSIIFNEIKYAKQLSYHLFNFRKFDLKAALNRIETVMTFD